MTKGVQIDSNDLINGFLPKTSIVVYEKPAVIASALLVKKIGTLNKAVSKRIITELVAFIQN